MPMEDFDTLKNTTEKSDHELMLSEVYKDDIELLYLDCCFSELIGL